MAATDANVRVVQELLQAASPSSPVHGARIVKVTQLANLWAGYGAICAVELALSGGGDDHAGEGRRQKNRTKAQVGRFILKSIRPPPSSATTGGGSEEEEDDEVDEGHLRKLLSYHVEANFYASLAAASLLASPVCSPHATIARLHSVIHGADLLPFGGPSSDPGGTKPQQQQAILIDDIREIGFPHLAEDLRGTLNEDQTRAALRWLAHFHAHFAGYLPADSSSPSSKQTSPSLDECPPPLEVVAASRRHQHADSASTSTSPSAAAGWNGRGVWKVGGYSYVATRLTELAQIPTNSIWAQLGLNDPDLAHAIDWALSPPGSLCGPAAGQTLIHGDVKSANLAFSADADRASAYDFQFVGRGLGVTDLAKFLTTSVSAATMNKREGEQGWLRYYHEQFIQAVRAEPAPRWLSADPERLRASRAAAAEYSFDDLLEHWDLAVLSWQRFQAGWGAWGNTQWTQARSREILERPGWKEALLKRWRSRNA